MIMGMMMLESMRMFIRSLQAQPKIYYVSVHLMIK